jgi:polysaccharide export outer membrane protein
MRMNRGSGLRLSRVVIATLATAILLVPALDAQDKGTSQPPPEHPAAAAPAAQPAANDQPLTKVEPAEDTPKDQQSTKDQPPAQPTQQEQVKVPIGAGDLLDISVYGVPELSQKVRVSSEGEAYLALIGYVHLDGLTVEEGQALIEKKLSDGGFVVNPHVTIFISEYVNTGVAIMGEIQRPGIYPVYGTRRLFDLIAAAGGLTNRAGKLISISHRDPPATIQIKFADDPAKSPETNVVVLPGDTIVISRAGVIYVVGDVNHPSGFVMDNNENLTVLQALALAGGASPTAALDGAKIIRKTSSGREEVPVQLKKILTEKAKDVAMLPDDILFIPGSPAKGFANRTLTAIVQMATGVAIRR